MKKFIFAAGALLLLPTLIFAVSMVNKPAEIAAKTFQTDNIIYNYEWFHDTARAFDARVAQIAEQRKFMADEQDAQERIRLRTELSGMQQSCRDLAAKYNANSTKSNRSIFKGTTLPGNLAEVSCE